MIYRTNLFSHTTMEKLRPLVADKLNVSLNEIKLPYDLLSLMDPLELWRNLSQDLDTMIFEVVK